MIPPVSSGADGSSRVFAVNREGNAFLADLDHTVPTVDLGPGRVIQGDDNEVFGLWNSLVAWLPATRSVRLIAAHGGEIFPGRLADHIATVRVGVARGRLTPVQLDLDISMACPSACTFCFSAHYRVERGSGRFMSWAAIERTIRSARSIGVKVVRFDGGGDPLASPCFADAVALCASEGLVSAVLTSGDLLRAEMLPGLVRAGTYVRVSLNSATDETRMLLHRTPRRFGVQRVLEVIRELDDLRRLTYGPAAAKSMPIGGTSMIHPANVAETFAIAEAGKRAGLDHISFRVILGNKLKVTFSEDQEQQYRIQHARIVDELADDGFRVFFPTRPLTDTGYVPREYFSRCLSSTHRALVEVGADPSTPALVPCGRYRGRGFNDAGDMVLGQLADGRGLDSVWLSPSMSAVVARLPDACGDCIDRSANVMLNGIHDAIAEDSGAEFFRFARPTTPRPAST